MDGNIMGNRSERVMEDVMERTILFNGRGEIVVVRRSLLSKLNSVPGLCQQHSR